MNAQISTHRATPYVPSAALHFTQLFSATPRGARLARLLTVHQLTAWGWPPACATAEAAALVVAELAANAVTHGRVSGRGFRLTLTVTDADADAGTLRIEVTDPRGERALPPGSPTATPLAESGRGLLLVDALATRWGTAPYPPSGKTVWACLPLL
ncbi:ATP-binding protein [Streptomyces sp. NPDC012637]|uniref:ATP-binding protein n=1 Tax=Streptomyces sp. NPDC012637 TaxID=3364842 RepID=UPI0036E7C6BE